MFLRLTAINLQAFQFLIAKFVNAYAISHKKIAQQTNHFSMKLLARVFAKFPNKIVPLHSQNLMQKNVNAIVQSHKKIVLLHCHTSIKPLANVNVTLKKVNAKMILLTQFGIQIFAIASAMLAKKIVLMINHYSMPTNVHVCVILHKMTALQHSQLGMLRNVNAIAITAKQIVLQTNRCLMNKLAHVSVM
jgi:hypothetical protein